MYIEHMDRADLEIAIIEHDIVPLESITDETPTEELREIVRNWVLEDNEAAY